MAQGIRQGIVREPLNWVVKQEGKAGAACTAGKALLPMLSDIVKPKIALTWLYVVSFWILRTVGYS